MQTHFKSRGATSSLKIASTWKGSTEIGPRGSSSQGRSKRRGQTKRFDYAYLSSPEGRPELKYGPRAIREADR
jgi:hypothetical protein